MNVMDDNAQVKKTRAIEDLKELGKQAAYTFLRNEQLYVFTRFLEFDEPKKVELLREEMHLKKNILDRALIGLKEKKFISWFIDYEFGEKDPSKLSDAQRKKCQCDKYFIDYPQFVNNLWLRIIKTQEYYDKKAGGQENLLYECPNCRQRDTMANVVSTYSDGNFHCSNCGSILEKVKEDDEVNRRNATIFRESTAHLLEMIKNVSSFCMIDERDERANPKRLYTHDEIREKNRINKDKNQKRSMSGEKSISISTAQYESLNTIVEPLNNSMKTDMDILKSIEEDKIKEIEMIKVQPLFEVDGKKFTADELRIEMDSFPPDLYHRAFIFLQENDY